MTRADLVVGVIIVVMAAGLVEGLHYMMTPRATGAMRATADRYVEPLP
ncbi:MAG TPA: hypothetical protein VFA59_09890 [Vicinamibacterales bacterium]|nr:hypothetical protein [Vicinamibacterales bacterium]